MTTVPGVDATHPCMRCGRAVVDPGAALCEECNPLGLSQPSATQVHGIAIAGIAACVVVLAILAKLALGGVGPFRGEVLTVSPSTTDGALAVTLRVENDGTKAAATTCTLAEAGAPVGSPIEVVQTPVVPAAGSIEFEALVAAFGGLPTGLLATCASP